MCTVFFFDVVLFPAQHCAALLMCDALCCDLVTAGVNKDFRFMRARAGKYYELKTQVLGPGKQHLQHVRVFNRILTWTGNGGSYEADPRHAEIRIGESGVKGAQRVVTAGKQKKGTTPKDNEIRLDEYHTSKNTKQPEHNETGKQNLKSKTPRMTHGVVCIEPVCVLVAAD